MPHPHATGWPRWALPTLLFTVLLVAGLVSAEIVLLRGVGRSPTSGPGDQAGRQVPEAKAPLSSSEQNTKPQERPEPTPTTLSNMRGPVVNTVTGAIPDEILRSLGGLLGANLYQGYLNIGFLADAVEEDLYTLDEARKLLNVVAALIDASEAQIGKLPADKLPVEDRQHLEHFRAVVAPLKTQVKELRLYWDTDKKEHAARFQKARAEAQTALEALVGK